MFERYTEKARRVIFFARYEASQFGLPNIETEHLLLGLLREDKALANRFFRSHSSVEAIRKQIEAHTTIREKVSTSADLPLSTESKRVLANAAEEAERLGHKHIGTEHLLLGLLREEDCFAAKILTERNLKLETVRDELAHATHEPDRPTLPEAAPPLAAAIGRDLTKAATEGQLEPVLGREHEIDAVLEVLSSLTAGNPLLVGESGVGKTAIVEAIAQRIASGMAPSFLSNARILAYDAQLARDSEAARHFLRGGQVQPAPRAAVDEADLILFVGDLRSLLAPDSSFAAGLLRSSPLRGRVRCILTSTPGDYRECLRAAPWIDEFSRAVFVRPLDAEEALKVVRERKARLEQFHEVKYLDEALEHAVQAADRYLPNRALPGKALDLLDTAGARVKIGQAALPAEIAELQKRIQFIVRRLDTAIANHEFEKARFYSDEERKERENLLILRAKYSVEETPSNEVNGENVEDVIGRWAVYPFRPWEEE
jgi:ATP-dependent Clp protease ATP-binding subunit ClpC